MSRIAVLGAGRMGTAMTRALLAAGHEVAVWNRTRQHAAPLARAGATVVDTPAGAAQDAQLVIVLLSDAAAVETAVIGSDGACAGLAAQAVLVQMSTIGPQATERLATRLPTGTRLVDAPVKGSVPQIENGELIILAAGAAEDIATVEAELSAVGRVQRCGAIPAGSAAKLVVNAAMISAVAAVAEVRTLARSLDLPAELTAELLTTSPLAGGVSRSQAAGAQFPVSLAAKDLGLALQQNSQLAVLAAAREELTAFDQQSADLAALVPDSPQ